MKLSFGNCRLRDVGGSVLVPVVLFALSAIAYAEEPPTDASCSTLLAGNTSMQIDSELQIRLESHKLADLFELTQQHPSIVMSSYQRLEAMIDSAGVTEVADPLSPTGKVTFLELFSGGGPVTDGKKVVGQLQSISDIYTIIRAGARGDRSGNSVPMLIGESGTGKTEMLTVLARAALNLTTKDSEHFMYSYEWTGLEQIPALAPYMRSYTAMNNETVNENIPAPLNDSPFVLLPKDAQDNLLASMKDKMFAKHGFKLDPVRKPNPACAFIRDRVLEYYAKANGGKALSNQQVIEALNKHIVIKRSIMGRPDTAPIIDAQPRDVDYAGLFLAPNPLVKSIMGPAHPMSWFYNGKFLTGSGFGVILDEYPRNDIALRNMFLRAFESREVGMNGSPTVPFDAFIIAAGNSESYDNTGKDAKAQWNRFMVTRFDWTIYPLEVMHIFLYMKQKEMSQQKLLGMEETKAPNAALESPQPLQLKDIFPNPKWGTPFLGPDGRYNMTFGYGPEAVHVSPHALLHMALVIAATRLSTDAGKAKTLGDFKVINSAVFRDIVTRLQVLLGEAPINPSEAAELKKLSELLKEGSFGITARDAGRWLTQAIEAARKPENKNCLTPKLVREVFADMLDKGQIAFPGHDERKLWHNLENVIAKSFLEPRVQTDVVSAVGHQNGLAEGAYLDILEETYALQQDPGATSYTSERTGDKKTIDRNRLEEVKKLYADLNRRPFPATELARLYMLYASNPNPITKDGSKHDGLMKAVTAYFSQRLGQMMSASKGDPRVYGGMRQVMHLQKGYCDHCFKAAIEVAEQLRNQTDSKVKAGQ